MSTWLSGKTFIHKNAFQWDAYHYPVDRIPACTVRGVSAQGVSAQEVSAQEVSAQGRCLPRGSRGCLPGGCIPACNGADRYLWKHNNRKLHLRAIKTMPSKDYQCNLTISVTFYCKIQKKKSFIFQHVVMGGNLPLLVQQQNGNLFGNWLPKGWFPDPLWLAAQPMELETDTILNSWSTDQIPKVK